MVNTIRNPKSKADPVKIVIAYIIGILLGIGLVASIGLPKLTIPTQDIKSGADQLGLMLGVGILLFLAIVLGTFIVYQLFLFADR